MVAPRKGPVKLLAWSATGGAPLSEPSGRWRVGRTGPSEWVGRSLPGMRQEFAAGAPARSGHRMPLLAPVIATTLFLVPDIASSFNLSDLKETICSGDSTLNAWPFVKSARSFTIWQAQNVTGTAASAARRRLAAVLTPDGAVQIVNSRFWTTSARPSKK